MSAPLITIGITCYNAADTITRAIESARAQDWPNTEIIVVDDLSTDASRDIIAQFSDVRLVKHPVNKGPGGARQTLVNEAQGDFLVFFDDDDESLPHRLTKQYQRIIWFETENPGIMCACYGMGERIYPNNYKIEIAPPGRLGQAPQGPDMAGRILFFKDVPQEWELGATPSCALMARTETFKNVGGFDEDFRRIEDLDFAVRLALAGGAFIGTEEKVFIQHATVAQDKSHQKNLEAEQQLAHKHRDYLNQEHTYFHALYWPKLRFYHFQKKYFSFLFLLTALFFNAPLRTMRHLLQTGPKRLRHERSMKK